MGFSSQANPQLNRIFPIPAEKKTLSWIAADASPGLFASGCRELKSCRRKLTENILSSLRNHMAHSVGLINADLMQNVVQFEINAYFSSLAVQYIFLIKMLILGCSS
jgi:hypothetical protein